MGDEVVREPTNMQGILATQSDVAFSQVTDRQVSMKTAVAGTIILSVSRPSDVTNLVRFRKTQPTLANGG